jgi:iron complex outermembrane receptor protein
MKIFPAFLSGFIALTLPVTAYSETYEALYEMDFEQLMDVEVISIAKKPQSIRKTAAAIHVISQADIQRSGATTLPEVLRGVPGVQVAHIDGNKWAISIRGFNGEFANKLLVLIDGRSVYTPLFSGVYWNMQDIPLATIDRVEVVRGPGGALWGENAVNGVGNIITKSADETQGTELSFLAGSEDLIANILHGGKLSEDVSYQFYAKARKQDKYKNSPDHHHNAEDGRENIRTGFRLDGQKKWMLQGSYMRGQADGVKQTFTSAPISNLVLKDTQDYRTAHLLLRTKHNLIEENDLQIQAYYNYEEHNHFEAARILHTFDVDAQHQFQWGDKQAIIWGIGYRGVQDDLEKNNNSSFSPESRFSHTVSGFLQDEIQLSEDFRFTIGSKFSHNDYSGFEYQPSARLLWEVNSDHSIWTSVSRAVRTPSRVDSNIRAIGAYTEPFTVVVNGNTEQKAEDLLAIEAGYRGVFSETFSVDTTIFYHQYDDLRSTAPQAPDYSSFTIPLNFDNKIEAKSYGVELFAKWQVLDYWQLSASYSFLKVDARLKKGNMDTGNVNTYEHSSPQQQGSLQSTWQLPFDLVFNSAIYYTDQIKSGEVNDFTRLDLRLAWKPTEQFEFSIAGQNLLDSQHKEFTSIEGDSFNTEVPRSVYAKIITRF